MLLMHSWYYYTLSQHTTVEAAAASSSPQRFPLQSPYPSHHDHERAGRAPLSIPRRGTASPQHHLQP
jgi:hypothetical protein